VVLLHILRCSVEGDYDGWLFGFVDIWLYGAWFLVEMDYEGKKDGD
jgi:hypothetical protein